MLIQRALITAAAATAMLWSTAVLAHPKLLASTPAADSEVESPARVELKFNEKLVTQFSGAKLVMTEMPGMSGHGPMPMAVTVSASEDPNTMLLTPKQPLPAGTYRVDWRAVSSDTHPVTGNVTFKVK